MKTKNILNQSFIDALKVTSVCTLVCIMGCLFSDAVSIPIQVGLGGTAQQIHDSQNITFLQSNPSLLLAIPIMFLMAWGGLKYLGHDDIGKYNHN